VNEVCILFFFYYSKLEEKKYQNVKSFKLHIQNVIHMIAHMIVIMTCNNSIDRALVLETKGEFKSSLDFFAFFTFHTRFIKNTTRITFELKI